MGSKGKKGIKQMEKQQKLKREKGREKATVKKEAGKPKTSSIMMGDELLANARKVIGELKCITPYEVTSRLNLKIGATKQLLRSLADMGVIRLVSRSPRTLIYAAVEA